jgi:hypothetical protein
MENTEKKPQTIGEWLDWAERQGYDWANEAREETVRLRGEEMLSYPVESLYEATSYMFTWSISKKGHIYWQQICESL